MGEAAAEGGRGGCCAASAVAQGGEESEGEERNHVWGARKREWARPGQGQHRSKARRTGRRERSAGTRAREQLYGALAHPLARPPLALAEVDLLDTVPVVLVRLVVGRVVSRLGHAAKGPWETRRMRKAFDHGMVVGAV